jgi:hypothetical protein
MKKAGLFLGLLLLLGLNYQCTEDEDIQANTTKVTVYETESGEEASDGLDTKKD